METKNADLIIVDDNIEFIKLMIDYSLPNRTIATYEDPYEFLQEAGSYPKTTKIALDYSFKTDEIDGIMLAKKLHAEGFSELYLISSDNDQFGDELPMYLKLIDKTNLPAIFT